MTGTEFDSQMARMDSRWKNTYSDELKRILWNDFKGLSKDSFARIVSKLIGEERYAPLMPEFRREAAVERERSWKHQKSDHTREATEFMSGLKTSTSEEESWMFQAIIKRMKSEFSDSDWAAFMKLIETRFGKQSVTSV
jgi:hypothetical protein